jgi:hypothetical protein
VANAFLASLGHLIFKIFWGALHVSFIAALCVEDPPHEELLI